MHLGRRPSRLPQGGVGEVGPRQAWEEVVEAAVAREVDAVLLAGDVVESANGQLEAYGALLRGVRRLKHAQIDVVAVAGNHDVRELPRLADELPDFHLLGRNGRWSTHIVRRDGEPVARVLGWSFPDERVESSPLDGLPAAWREGRYDDGAEDDLCTVGLLHCDRDATGGPYAPVSSRALEQLGLSAWFLGHIHKPDIGASGRPLGYLGSLVAMDPGEPGVHGPWLATSRAGAWELEQLALSPTRYEVLEVDVSGCADEFAVQAAMQRAVQDFHARHELGAARCVSLRPRLVGESALSPTVLGEAMAQAAEEGLDPIDDVVYGFDKGTDDTRPVVDLEGLAKGVDPVALLARRLLDLADGDSAAGRELVARARERFGAVGAVSSLSGLGAPELDDAAVRELLKRSARRALARLLEQRDPASNEEVRA